MKSRDSFRSFLDEKPWFAPAGTLSDKRESVSCTAAKGKPKEGEKEREHATIDVPLSLSMPPPLL
jgi:hypothetical protein